MRRRVISFLLSAAVLFGLFCGIAPSAQAAGMKASDACVDMIKEMEGFSKYPMKITASIQSDTAQPVRKRTWNGT